MGEQQQEQTARRRATRWTDNMEGNGGTGDEGGETTRGEGKMRKPPRPSDPSLIPARRSRLSAGARSLDAGEGLLPNRTIARAAHQAGGCQGTLCLASSVSPCLTCIPTARAPHPLGAGGFTLLGAVRRPWKPGSPGWAGRPIVSGTGQAHRLRVPRLAGPTSARSIRAVASNGCLPPLPRRSRKAVVHHYAPACS